ncbi:MAG TPA: S16 family serine protease [Candidatus Babeliales bacterium]|nr:S16 family serine protease [Candidatus Babeliales bacterium]
MSRNYIYILGFAAVFAPLPTHCESFTDTIKEKLLFNTVYYGRDTSLAQLTVKTLLAQGTNPNVRDSNQSTPLMFASYYGYKNIVKALLSNSYTDINAINMINETSLKCACRTGHADIAEWLLKAGADHTVIDSHMGNNALLDAITKGHKEIVRLLLLHNADIAHTNFQGQNALTCAPNQEIRNIILIYAHINNIAIESLQESTSDNFAPSTRTEVMQAIMNLPISQSSKNTLYKEVMSADPFGSNKAYLDIVFSLPWNRYTKENIDPVIVEKALNEKHFGLTDAKNEILEYIALRAFAKDATPQILCLVGPPGTGKTSIAESIARSLGRKSARISVGGIHDECEIRGFRRSFISARPGRPITAIQQAGTCNPVIIIDEIDKINTMSGYGGDPSAALLELFDPEQNSQFSDNYLGIPYDFSKVLFIATANNKSKIPAPLLNRMKVIDLNGYTIKEKIIIAQTVLIPKQIALMGWQDHNITFQDEALTLLFQQYTKDAGMREAQQHIQSIFAKLAQAYLKGEEITTITPEHIKQFFGAPLLEDSYAAQQFQSSKDLASMYMKVKTLPIADQYKINLYEEIDNAGTATRLDQDSITKKHLEFVFSLPWHYRTQDNLDMEQIKEKLNTSHYGMDEIKEELLDFIATLTINKDLKSLPVLGLYGPPGIGKTSIARSIAESLGRKFIKISLGSVQYQSTLRGNPRVYVNATAGEIINAIKECGSSNPVIVLDEIDKTNDSVYATLLEILDPEQNSQFKDQYLDIPYDLSKVLFITTMNDASQVPWPLLDRMQIVTLAGYTLEEKKSITETCLINQVKKDIGLNDTTLSFEENALTNIIQDYTLETGVRQLKRTIRKLLSKIITYHLTTNTPMEKEIFITADMLIEHLGEPLIQNPLESQEDMVGIVNGLYWSPVGGGITKIEAALIPRTTHDTELLKLTGQMKEVMQESANIALSYAREHAQELGIDLTLLDTHFIHIHAPAGATPKDGPSAGITMLTAIASVLTNKKVDASCAMTGELNLRGQVTAIGGVNEKLLGAKQAGIMHVFLSEENIPDFKKAEKKGITQGMTITFVKNAKEVLDQVLID